MSCKRIHAKMRKGTISQAIAFYCMYPLLKGMSLMPMFILYRVSDLLFLFVATFGYRGNVINSNLRRAFPDKSYESLQRIKRAFYRHLCDLIVETIALGHPRVNRIKNRVKVINPEVILEPLENGNDVIAVLGHYCNWEWVPVVSFMVDAEVLSIYRPLNNGYFDNFLLKLRSGFKSVNVPMKNTYREIAKLKKRDRRFVLGLISDQSPGNYELNYWTTFLNQSTPILLGTEKVAKTTGAVAIYWQMKKVKRGYYEIKLIPFKSSFENWRDYEITEWHVRQLESQVIESPEFWLWSHNRWKYQHLRKNINHASES